jgi:toxin ParE1/3/4
MSRLQWSIEGRQDVDEVYHFIGQRDRRPATADAVVGELRDVCQSYADAFAAGSVLGTARADLGESFRVFTHKRWVIVFRPIDDGIEVLRVLDGSRDYSRLFGI